VQFDAVLFDLDGTLLDTLQDLADAVNTALEQAGFPIHPVDAYRYFVGSGALTLVTRALPADERNDSNIRACLRGFQEAYARNWRDNTAPYDGVGSMLDGVAELGIPMAVLSNKPDLFTRQCVATLLPAHQFVCVFGQREGMPPKPDPAGALDIADRLRIPLHRWLYLGDSGIDMKTAAATGMFGVGATWGFRTEDELRANGARDVIHHPRDLLELFEPLEPHR